MWKEFFYYSKSERRAILLLLAVLFCLSTLYSYLRINQHPSEAVTPEEVAMTDSFKAKQEVKEKQAKKRQEYRRQVRNPVIVLEEFDPNTADSATFRQLGLSAFTASNIMKYRDKGGVFRSAEAFSKIYGMSEEQYQTLIPYINIGDEFLARDTIFRSPVHVHNDSLSTIVKYAEGTVVDLNESDTTVLKMIPGIGTGIANMIVGYRNKLGGFYSVEQLGDLQYIDSTLYKWFTISPDTELRMIRVNYDGIDKLRNHPYMNFYKAKVIIEHRRKRGKIKNLSQLSMYKEFTEKDIKRLEPYLSFE